MNCDVCQEREAAFILGNTETGEQLTFCAPDFARWSIDFAKQILPADEITGQLGPLLVQGAEPPTETETRARKGRRKAAPAAEPRVPAIPPSPTEPEAIEASE